MMRGASLTIAREWENLADDDGDGEREMVWP